MPGGSGSGFGPGAGVGPGAGGGGLGAGEPGYGSGSGVGEPGVGGRMRGAGPVLLQLSQLEPSPDSRIAEAARAKLKLSAHRWKFAEPSKGTQTSRKHSKVNYKPFQNNFKQFQTIPKQFGKQFGNFKTIWKNRFST